MPSNGEARRSSRNRKSVERFQFDKAHGYAQVSSYISSLIKHCFSVKMTKTQREQNYLYVLALDPINGVADTSLFPPDYFTRAPYLFKSKKKGNDPDSPGIMEALTGPYRTEFLQAMQNEIEEPESHGTWEVIKRDAVPEVTDENGNPVVRDTDTTSRGLSDGEVHIKVQYCFASNYRNTFVQIREVIQK